MDGKKGDKSEKQIKVETTFKKKRKYYRKKVIQEK